MPPRTPDTPPEPTSDAQTEPQSDPHRDDESQRAGRRAQESILVVRQGHPREIVEVEESGEDDALMQVFTGP